MSYTNIDIFAKAKELAPEIGAESCALLSALCTAADVELKSRLKSGVELSEIEELFVTAAAMLALSMFTESSVQERMTEFTAGSLTVGLESENTSAASLRRQAENMLRCYIESDDFAFTGVAG